MKPTSASRTAASVLAGFAVFATFAESRGQPRSAGLTGPTLILEDSVFLEENDDTYIGQPLEMLLGTDGSLFVVDGFLNSVTQFGKTGQLIRVYGRQGGGPGEFAYIGLGGFATDAVLGAVDGRPPRMEIELFDLKSGWHLGRATANGFVTALAARRDRLWLGGIDAGEWKALGTKRLRDLPGGSGAGTESTRAVSLDRVSVPRPYRENDIIRGIGGMARLHVGEDDIVLGFAGSPFLLRVDPDGEVLDTVPLQAGQRRGVPDEDEFMEMMDPTKASYDEMFRATSSLMNVSRDDNGYIFTVHQDSELHGTQVSGRIYISSLKSDGSEQCPDTLVPTSDAGRPVTAFGGRELLVLDQRIHEGAGNRLRTVVRRFTVDPADCTGEVRIRS